MRHLAIVLSVGVLAAGPAAAATYTAKLVGPAEGRIVAREINWACAGDSCQGATQESRPEVLCQALAKRAGRIDSFLVDGQPFTASELGKCNAAAKPVAAKAVAAQ
jgi:hypothetical protein